MIKKNFVIICIILVSISVYAEFLFKNNYTVPAALGNAYTAFVYDAYSIYFNPAVLPYLSDNQIISSKGEMYQMEDLGFSNIGFQKNFKDLGLGIAYDDFGFDLYKEKSYYFSLGYKLDKDFSIGTNLKILSLNIQTLGSKEVFSYDLSAFYKFNRWMNFGVIGRNLNEPTLSTKVEKSFQFGMTLSPFKILALNMDYYIPPYSSDNRFLAGVQFNISNTVLFRLGYQTNPNNISTGLGFNIGKNKKILSINYTLIHNQIFDYTHIIGIDYKFDNLIYDLSDIKKGEIFKNTKSAQTNRAINSENSKTVNIAENTKVKTENLNEEKLNDKVKNANIRNEVKPESKLNDELDAKIESEIEPELESETEPEPEVETESETEPETESEIEKSNEDLEEFEEEDLEELEEETAEQIEAAADTNIEKIEEGQETVAIVIPSTGKKRFLTLDEIEEARQSKEFSSSNIDIGQIGLINRLILSQPITVENEIWDLFYAGEIKEEDANLLQELFDNPVNINTDRIEDLYKLPNLTSDDVLNIINTRKKTGNYEVIEDLLTRNVLNPDVFEYIKLFISTAAPTTRLIKYDFNYDETLSDKKTAKLLNDITITKEKYTLNFLTERDKGEEQIDNLLKWSVKTDNILNNGDRLIIGNYGVNFGYNVVFNKLTTKEKNILDFDDNKNEYENLEGIAYQIKNLFKTKLDVTIFNSKNYYEADVNPATRSWTIKLSNSGDKRDREIEEKLIGSNINFKYSEKLSLGLTGYTADYDVLQLDHKYTTKILGYNFTYLTPLGVILFGENAFQKDGGNALLLGLDKKGDKFDMDLNYLNNDKDFVNLQSYDDFTKCDAKVYLTDISYKISKVNKINLHLEEGREKTTDLEYSKRIISWSDKWDEKTKFVSSIKILKDLSIVAKNTEIDYDANNFSDSYGRYYLVSSSRYSYFGSTNKTDNFERKYDLTISSNFKSPLKPLSFLIDDNFIFSKYTLKYYNSEKNKYTSDVPTLYKKHSYEHIIEGKFYDWQTSLSYKIYNTSTAEIITYNSGIYNNEEYFEEENIEEEEEVLISDTGVSIYALPTITDSTYNLFKLNLARRLNKYNIVLNYQYKTYENSTSKNYHQVSWTFDFGNILLKGYYKIYLNDENDIIKCSGTIRW